MDKSVRAIVGRSDRNMSSALDSLPRLYARTDLNNRHDYTLVSDREQVQSKKNPPQKSNVTTEFDREESNIHGKMDQFEVDELIDGHING
jgi:hypothetical protein